MIVLCGTSRSKTFKHVPHVPSVISPHRLPGHPRTDSLQVGSISYPLILTCSDAYYERNGLASNTVRRSACGFHANY
ncbi:hypothetical protein TNCV_3958631 [Trichonephila clavipes]|nr:hypothetical protein TNCV_3958631 [Trichonephila clavipes]